MGKSTLIGKSTSVCTLLKSRCTKSYCSRTRSEHAIKVIENALAKACSPISTEACWSSSTIEPYSLEGERQRLQEMHAYCILKTTLDKERMLAEHQESQKNKILKLCDEPRRREDWYAVPYTLAHEAKKKLKMDREIEELLAIDREGAAGLKLIDTTFARCAAEISSLVEVFMQDLGDSTFTPLDLHSQLEQFNSSDSSSHDAYVLEHLLGEPKVFEWSAFDECSSEPLCRGGLCPGIHRFGCRAAFDSDSDCECGSNV